MSTREEEVKSSENSVTGSPSPGQRQLRKCTLVKYVLDGVDFIVPRRYQIMKKIGHGAYGLVAQGFDRYMKKTVAIKKIPNVFTECKELQKRILREILILNHFKRSSNIVKMLDIFLPVSYDDFLDVYVVMEFMDSDMKKLLESGQTLEDVAVKYFTYQVLRSLLTLQTAGVLHRDIKPANILVNSEMDLKLCDFGISRGYSLELDPEMSTKYVSTRWYRAPELLFLYEKAGPEIDMWSVGCILGELLANPHLPLRLRVMFPGRSYFSQIDTILEKLGKPENVEEEIKGCKKAKDYVKAFKPFKKSNQLNKNWSKKFPKANSDALDLLDKLLQINPQKRITVEEAMKHPYLEEIYKEDAMEDIKKTQTFDFRMTKIPENASIKRMIYDFIVLWNMKRSGYSGAVLLENEILVK